MNLKQVTLTGADGTIKPKELLGLTKNFPFVEWGILLSKHSGGDSRYPSRDWVLELFDLGIDNFSGHICGRWVRDICNGDWSILQDFPEVMQFKRLQLNFRACTHLLREPEKFFIGLKDINKEVIFQIDGVNNLCQMAREMGINAVPLYDISGGRGILPENWPQPIKGIYQGYAGGLGPENLEAQLLKIESVVGDYEIWVDMETRIRNSQDVFDLEMCCECLEISKKWFKKG